MMETVGKDEYGKWWARVPLKTSYVEELDLARETIRSARRKAGEVPLVPNLHFDILHDDNTGTYREN